MPILRALGARSQPASAAQIFRVTEQGTAAGIRRALDRLATHGICTREELGGRTLYSLNHEHVLYPSVVKALDANDELLRRLRRDLDGWTPEPMSGVLFGSAARREGTVESDIDLLLIRPTTRASALERKWTARVHELRGEVHRWTGNHLQIVDWTHATLRRHASRQEPLIEGILRDGITLAGTSLAALLDGLAAPPSFRKEHR